MDDRRGCGSLEVGQSASRKKKPPQMPLWMAVAVIYFGYRVIKGVTGGSRYAG
jgi:hypothetical protein